MIKTVSTRVIVVDDIFGHIDVSRFPLDA
jgi:hypothetical protein